MRIEWLWAAGAVQLAIAGANFPAKKILPIGADLERVSPIVRQIYRVQHAYIVGLLVLLAAASALYAREILAGGPWAALLAVFWGARLLIQRFYYDPDVRRRHRAADVVFTLAFAYLTTIFAVAAAGGAR